MMISLHQCDNILDDNNMTWYIISTYYRERNKILARKTRLNLKTNMQSMRDTLAELKEESSKLKLELAHTPSVTFSSEQLLRNDVMLPECLTVVLTHIISTLRLLPTKVARNSISSGSSSSGDDSIHHNHKHRLGSTTNNNNLISHKKQNLTATTSSSGACGNISTDDSISSTSSDHQHHHNNTIIADESFKEASFIVLNAVSANCPIVYASPGFLELTGTKHGF